MYLNYISFNNFFEATNGSYFKIDKTIFSVNQKTFEISFNRSFDINSLEPYKRNFKIYYKEKKLKILDIAPLKTDNRTLTIYIDKKSIEMISSDKDIKSANYTSNFTLDIANIKDINGFEINKRPSIKLNQYRELFVQEVFVNKKIPIQQNFVDKSLPLSKTIITPVNFKDAYWINSPLKKSKQ